jgi:hypothetical protein
MLELWGFGSKTKVHTVLTKLCSIHKYAFKSQANTFPIFLWCVSLLWHFALVNSCCSLWSIGHLWDAATGTCQRQHSSHPVSFHFLLFNIRFKMCGLLTHSTRSRSWAAISSLQTGSYSVRVFFLNLNLPQERMGYLLREMRRSRGLLFRRRCRWEHRRNRGNGPSRGTVSRGQLKQGVNPHRHLWADCLENVRASTSHNPVDLHGLSQG